MKYIIKTTVNTQKVANMQKINLGVEVIFNLSPPTQLSPSWTKNLNTEFTVINALWNPTGHHNQLHQNWICHAPDGLCLFPPPPQYILHKTHSIHSMVLNINNKENLWNKT